MTEATSSSTWNIAEKVVLITGSNDGIGKATAMGLAKAGARVILACRNVDAGQVVASEIRKAIEVDESSRRVYCGPKLDLNSFQSVRNFAAEFLRNEDRLDVLILNAGMYGPDSRTVTGDGIETTFQCNHLGHFLLTNLLLNLLKMSAPSRIVILSSDVYKEVPKSSINFEDPGFETPYTYGGRKAYCQSKLANILFAVGLKSRLENSNVSAYVVHPGKVKTEIINKQGGTTFSSIVMSSALAWFGKTPEMGALTSIYCASQPDLDKSAPFGTYFVDSKPRLDIEAFARDAKAAEKLWKLSEELVAKTITQVK